MSLAANSMSRSKTKKQGTFYLIMKDLRRNYQLALLVLIPTIYIIIFNYFPLYGLQLAFKKYNISKGIWGSEWVGFRHLTKFFSSYQFSNILKNTLSISVYSMIVNFITPIVLALSLNYAFNPKFKKVVQIATYAPHFISMVVMVGIIVQFLSLRTGFFNRVIQILGFEPILFMGKPKYFSSILVWSGAWKNTGWSSIIYLAALAGISREQHEAAIIDGASLLKRIMHIDIPGILPTVTILLILSVGQLMNVGFQKILLMQNDLNIQASEVISTYVYKVGLASAAQDYSYATAIGMFNSVINFILLITVNKAAQKLSETSLW